VTPTYEHVSRDRSDRGSVSVLMCVIVLIGVTLAAFLIEAGSTIQAATRADIDASEAARAAVAAAGPNPTSNDTQLAVAAAQNYLAAAGGTGTATPAGPGLIDVQVTVNTHTPLLGLPVTETAHHTAQLLIGARQGEGP
jgi:Flp pilus assembly protein TadG